MSLEHKKIQKDLLDVYYGEKSMTEEIRRHLNTCSECTEYWNELELIKKNMTLFDTDIEIDERIIGRAFRKSSIIMERRKNIKDLLVFAVISSLILSVLGLIIYMGYGKRIIMAQIIIMVCVPLLVPFMIRQRLMEEEQ
ncbi:hypothetical protein [Acetivibrio clariflavus]|uniref:Zinc-finger n=1 Tax=Acetivibrio clariflavus (strain DSM 19732 / NBRC 101661 / EBR45) TaxID=720554 RepID=G8LUV3_ACECE|nr:hypothetical protein [Acetivibrio clariflavus]AEV68483.1 hypothetical protein Clocl_1876 [Acetivibrio clariflavus DSM 19732]